MNLEVVLDCWSRAPTGSAFLPVQLRDKGAVFVDREPINTRRTRVLEFLEIEQPENADLYFSPLTFTDGLRRNDKALAPMSVLYADLDAVNPEHCPYRPSVAWETSPGSYQALWWLARPVPRPVFRALNQAMTYFVGADRGGWMESKVLRVPGSINWKRGGVPGRLLWHSQSAFSPDFLHMKLPMIERREGTLPEPRPLLPIPLDRKYWADLIEAARPRLGPGVMYLLTKANVDDRSVHIWKVAQALERAGVPKEEAFQLIWHAPYNKYRQENRVRRLWSDIKRAYST